MSLLPTDKLALRIYKATRSSGLDEHPLVAVGTVPVTFKPKMPLLVNESEVWLLIHDQEYTIYSYFAIIGTTTYSFILISLFVPADMRLSADNSPHDLLSNVFENFKKQGNSSSVDTTPFEQLLARCVLEERPKDMPLPIMTGQKPASFCADSKAQVSALLRFSQYAQLSNVSHLEIGYQCDTTIRIPIKAKQKPSPIQVQKLKTEHPLKTTIQQDSKQKNTSGEVQTSKQDINSDLHNLNGNSTIKKPNKKAYWLRICFYSFIVIVISFVGFMYIGIPSEEPTLKLVPEQPAPIEDDEEIYEKIKNLEDSVVKNTRTMIREKILFMVNHEDLQDFKRYARRERWKEHLTNKEQMAIEAVLNMRKYKDSLRKRVNKKIEGEFPFQTWDHLIATGHRIVIMVNEEKAEEAEKMRKEQIIEQAKKKHLAPSTIPTNNTTWRTDIRKKADSCPITLRLGVRITSIICTITSVTCIVTYEELSKYDVSKKELKHVIDDRSNVISTYGKGLPKEISINVIQKDRAGRTL